MHTYSKTHLWNIEGNIHYCVHKVPEINASISLYCSNTYIQILQPDIQTRHKTIIVTWHEKTMHVYTKYISLHYDVLQLSHIL